MQHIKNRFISISVLLLLSLAFTACDSGSKDIHNQTDTEHLLVQALEKEMDKVPSVPSHSDAPSELQKARDHYFERNADAAIPILTNLAKQNNPDAHYYLGLIYTDNEFQYVDVQLGLSHLSTAINLGYSQAMHHMA